MQPSIFFFNVTAPPVIYTLSLHDALPIYRKPSLSCWPRSTDFGTRTISVTSARSRSEEHTSELQSPVHLVCRLLLEKKNLQQPVIKRLESCNDLHHDKSHLLHSAEAIPLV